MSIVPQTGKSVSLIFDDKPIEISSTQIPIFTNSTVSAIKKLSKAVPHYSSFKKGVDLQNKIFKLADKIEALKDAKDHKTRNIILGVIRGIFFVATVAASIFAGYLVFGTTVATTISGIPAAFIFGVITSFGLAIWNTSRSMEIRHWAHLLAALFIAPFAPTYHVFSTISTLEKEISVEKADYSALIKNLCEFYSNEAYTRQVKQVISQRIQELTTASQAITENTNIKTIILEEIAMYNKAIQEFDAAILYFTKIPVAT